MLAREVKAIVCKRMLSALVRDKILPFVAKDEVIRELLRSLFLCSRNVALEQRHIDGDVNEEENKNQDFGRVEMDLGQDIAGAWNAHPISETLL